MGAGLKELERGTCVPNQSVLNSHIQMHAHPLTPPPGPEEDRRGVPLLPRPPPLQPRRHLHQEPRRRGAVRVGGQHRQVLRRGQRGGLIDEWGWGMGVGCVWGGIGGYVLRGTMSVNETLQPPLSRLPQRPTGGAQAPRAGRRQRQAAGGQHAAGGRAAKGAFRELKGKSTRDKGKSTDTPCNAASSAPV